MTSHDTVKVFAVALLVLNLLVDVVGRVVPIDVSLDVTCSFDVLTLLDFLMCPGP